MASITNESVTYDDNILQYRCSTLGLQKFYDECVQINIHEGRPFTYFDFKDKMSNGNFRQKIFHLREVITTDIRSSIGMYTVRGVLFSKRYRPITFERTGLGNNILKILCDLRSQPPALHNVKVKTSSSKMHAILVSKGLKEDPDNHGVIFPLNMPPFTTKLHAYSNGTVHIDIACTSTPIAYSIQGVQHFLFFLGRYYQFLVSYTDNMLDLPYPSEWIVTQYHFGKDGKEELSGPAVEHRFEDVTAGLFRFYSKKMLEGKVIPRIELIESPNRRLSEEIGLMIRDEMSKEGSF